VIKLVISGRVKTNKGANKYKEGNIVMLLDRKFEVEKVECIKLLNSLLLQGPHVSITLLSWFVLNTNLEVVIF